MKPFWKPEYRDQFCERAGLYLLYAFILSIALNPIIVVLFAQRSDLNYVVATPSMALSPTPKDLELMSEYRVVSPEYAAMQKQFADLESWIIITALLGWIVTSPRFDRGWKKIRAKIASNEPITTEPDILRKK